MSVWCGGGGLSCREERWGTQACGRGWKGVGAGDAAVLVGEVGGCGTDEVVAEAAEATPSTG